MHRHATLCLELFGGPVLYRGEQSVSMSPFQVSLLTLLLAEGRERLPRQDLQRLLWGDPEGHRARHRLSQLLYQVNQKVEERLGEVEGDTVRVYQGIVGCDLDDFEEHIRRPDFKAAGDLLRRGFLAAFPAPPSEAFEDWMDLRRVEIRSRLRDKALASWAAAEASQDWGLGRQAAEALLLLDPRDEVVLRRVMKARAMGGMVREAEAVYLGFAERRSRGGEWEPAPETAELLASVRATFQRPRVPPDIAVPPSLEVPLCGRDEELGFLTRSIFKDRRGGRRRTVIIGGEAGLGKTRLVNEALQGARFRGFRVLRARPAELERNIPLNPLLEALNQEWVGQVLLELEDPWRSVLLSLMPQFHEGPGPLPEVPYVQPGSLPRRTYEAFFRLFRAASDQSPTLLFIDDFQWADETSAAVLQFMHRRWPKGDLGLILTYRQGDLEQADLVGRFVTELESDGDVVTIRLEELDEAASTELVESVASERLSASALREVVGLAGGNPFFLVELTADYVADRTPERRGDGVPLPLSVRQMIARRIRELDPVAKQIVSGLSVFVHPTSLGRLTRMSGFAREECVDGLETLQRLRLVDWAEGGVSCRHDIVRRAVYDDLSPARRSLLHGRIAEMLESEPGDPPKDQLALHYYKAGERELALKYALEAADEAEASGGNETVRTALSLALLVSTGGTRAQIGARLSQALFASRRLADAIEQGRTVLSEGELLAPSERLRLELTVVNAERLLGRRSPGEALGVLGRIRSEAAALGAEELCLDVLDTTLHVLDRAGASDEAAALVQDVRRRGPYASPQAQCKALSIQTMAYLYGEVERGLDAGRRAVAIARSSGLDGTRLQALNRLLLGLLLCGRLESDEGRRVVSESLRCASSSGDIVSHALLLGNLASWHLAVADYDAAARFLNRLERRIETTDSPFLRFLYHTNRGALLLETEGASSALDEFALATDVGGAAVSPQQLGLFHAARAMALLEAGRLAQAMRVSETLELPDSWSGDASPLFLLHARLESRRGRARRGLELLEQGMSLALETMPVAWLRMANEFVKLERRTGAQSKGVATIAYDLATELRLPFLSERFRPFVA